MCRVSAGTLPRIIRSFTCGIRIQKAAAVKHHYIQLCFPDLICPWYHCPSVGQFRESTLLLHFRDSFKEQAYCQPGITPTSVTFLVRRDFDFQKSLTKTCSLVPVLRRQLSITFLGKSRHTSWGNATINQKGEACLNGFTFNCFEMILPNSPIRSTSQSIFDHFLLSDKTRQSFKVKPYKTLSDMCYHLQVEFQTNWGKPMLEY